LAEIRNYCETDVVNTYLVYARFQMMRGVLSRDGFQRECDLVRSELAKLDVPHWREYLAAWPEMKS
jgi:predicted PolB exonuclease-like 3'-5' exonuclease